MLFYLCYKQWSVTTRLYNNYGGVLNFLFLLFISMVLCRLRSSGGPTATLGTDVSRLPAQGCDRTVFQLVLDGKTSAMNSLSGCKRLICLCVEIAAHCDYLFKLRLSKFSYLPTYLLSNYRRPTQLGRLGLTGSLPFHLDFILLSLYFMNCFWQLNSVCVYVMCAEVPLTITRASLRSSATAAAAPPVSKLSPALHSLWQLTFS